MPYSIAKHSPTYIQFEEKGNFYIGFGFFIIGIIGMIASAYFTFLIISSTSFGESSLLLTVVESGNVPFAFFFVTFGAFTFIYSLKELFFTNGWIITSKNTKEQPGFIIYWNFLFFKSKQEIDVSTIKGFTIITIYYDQLKNYYRRRLELEYYPENSDFFSRLILIHENKEKLQPEIESIIKESSLICKKQFSIEEKESK